MLSGRWVHVFGLRSLGGGVSGDGGRGRSQRAAEAFAQAVEEGAAVTRAGTDAAGDAYHVEVHLPKFIEALFEAAQGLVPQPPPEEIEAVPDERVTFDVWLDDGELRRVEADIAQLIDVTRPGAAIERDPLILRIDVEPFDPTELRHPRPSARVHVQAFLQLLLSARAAP